MYPEIINTHNAFLLSSHRNHDGPFHTMALHTTGQKVSVFPQQDLRRTCDATCPRRATAPMEALLGGCALTRKLCSHVCFGGNAVPAHSSSSLSTAEDGRVKQEDEEEDEKAGGSKGWTSEQLDIVSALLQRPPRPFPATRLAPRLLFKPPPRLRPVGVPPVRHAHTHLCFPRLAKDKHFLTNLAAQISELPDDQHVSCILHSCRHLLIRGSLSATIHELGHLGLPLRALETFEWQQQCTHLWPDERTLCASIQVLAEAHMEKKAWNLLHAHAPASTSAFQALTRGLIAAGLLHRALMVKKEAEKCGFLLGAGEYAELILLASRLNRMQVVRKLVQELGTFPELELDLEHCTSVMVACRKACMYDAVLGLFQWWKHAGLSPNVVMYEIVMTSLSSLGKHREALAIYWNMEKDGCAPNLVVYTALFEICTQLGDAPRAIKLFSKMRNSNIAPTPSIYGNLIRLCHKDGRSGKARELMVAMKKEGLPLESLHNYVGD